MAPDDDTADLIAQHVMREASTHFRDLGSDETEVQNWLTACAGAQRWRERMACASDKVVCVMGSSGVEATGAASIDSDGVAHLGSIYVAERARRRGLARQIVQQLVQWATAQGAGHAQMETAEPNAAMRTLARELGFELANTYWDETITNVRFCVYRRSLTETSDLA